jgi:Raf kinase inhibitor-like YbhB/YbcL family protein
MAQPQHAGSLLTIQAVEPLAQRGLTLVSGAIDAEGLIDPIYSAEGDNLSPPLSWTADLEAESFALIVEDPDAPGDEPFIHWMIWDIPGSATELPRGVANAPRLDEPQGAIQGRNGKGAHGWFGPRPPVGHGPHRYHFQLFALGKLLGMGPETDLKTLINALKGNVLAAGELVGVFEVKDPVADASSPGRTGGYGAEPSNERPTGREQEAGRGGLDEDDPDRHAPHDADGEVRRRGGED